MHNAILLLYWNICSRVSSYNLHDMSYFVCAVQTLFCGMSTYTSFNNFCINLILKINNPLWHKHKAQSINRETLLKHVAVVTSILQKSFCSCKSNEKLLNLFENLIESCVKCCDYLKTNLDSVRDCQTQDDTQRHKTVNELPFNDKYTKLLHIKSW